MFAQVFMVTIGLLLFYMGVVEGSIFNIIIATLLLIISAGRFYAAKSGSSLQEGFDKWRAKRNPKTNGE
ncbi:MAG: hypothetical protein P8M49_05015 [Thalassotalea sp.]|nr:hypothetical protein [Thalassotalea sp.]MDG2392849.1 hypothetical protein [Thalassotalea sp.]